MDRDCKKIDKMKDKRLNDLQIYFLSYRRFEIHYSVQKSEFFRLFSLSDFSYLLLTFQGEVTSNPTVLSVSSQSQLALSLDSCLHVFAEDFRPGLYPLNWMNNRLIDESLSKLCLTFQRYGCLSWNIHQSKVESYKQWYMTNIFRNIKVKHFKTLSPEIN